MPELEGVAMVSTQPPFQPSEMLTELIANLQQSLNILQKQDIQTAAKALQWPKADRRPSQTFQRFASNQSAILNGDDCAAIPDGDRYLLLAAEGMSPSFVERDPWFAGWCAVTVNISDVAAMGGWPIAVVDALWSPSLTAHQDIWDGMNAAAAAFGVPIVGGHTNCHSPYLALAAAILGQADHLITSFDAQPGDVLLVVMDLRGEFYRDYPFWNAATQADPNRLRDDLKLLPALAQAELCRAGKDISMGGIAGTLLMLAETSGVGAVLKVDAIAKPDSATWEKWLTCFPSFGYLLSVAPENVAAVTALFEARDISCVQAGTVTAGSKIELEWGCDGQRPVGDHRKPLWNLQTHPLTGFSPAQA